MFIQRIARLKQVSSLSLATFRSHLHPNSSLSQSVWRKTSWTLQRRLFSQEGNGGINFAAKYLNNNLTYSFLKDVDFIQLKRLGIGLGSKRQECLPQALSTAVLGTCRVRQRATRLRLWRVGQLLPGGKKY